MTVPRANEIGKRPRIGWWTGHYFVSVCIGGYGLSLGWLSPSKHPKWDDWLLVRPFRNYAYRGLR